MEEEYIKTMIRFNDLSQSLSLIQTLEDVCNVLEEISDCLGFQHYTYVAGLIYAGQRLLGWKPDKRPLSVTNIPADFYKEYSVNRLDYFDPILKFSMGAHIPSIWSSIYDIYPIGKNEKKFISLSEDFQIKQGYVFPIHGPGNDFGVASFATPKHLLPMTIPESIIAMLNLLLHKLHDHVNSKFRNFTSIEILTLSPREIDVLLWTAEGKSAWEIGKILTISERTVEQYINSACQKLGVNTKFAAVSKIVTVRFKEPA